MIRLRFELEINGKLDVTRPSSINESQFQTNRQEKRKGKSQESELDENDYRALLHTVVRNFVEPSVNHVTILYASSAPTIKQQRVRVVGHMQDSNTSESDS